MHGRSHLYVPGDRGDRQAKAFSRGADALIVDLEDAVRPAAKLGARQLVAEWLATIDRPGVPVWVRINPGELREGDVRAVAVASSLTGLVVAKAERVDELIDLDRLLTSMGSKARVAPLVESAVGVVNAVSIAAGPRVSVLHLGEVDLAADLRITPSADEHEWLYVRSQVVLASRAAGIDAPVAPVSVNLTDVERFQESSHALRNLGFGGRACIHPAQVAVANGAFSPTPEELRWAKGIVSHHGSDSMSATRDAAGNMIDEAVLRRARDLLTVAATQ